ncbi:MAG: hypothetical protein J6Y62_01870 [Clostridia bacterium]|nr:hypothetical protein [Clostridia bacterium]
MKLLSLFKEDESRKSIAAAASELSAMFPCGEKLFFARPGTFKEVLQGLVKKGTVKRTVLPLASPNKEYSLCLAVENGYSLVVSTMIEVYEHRDLNLFFGKDELTGGEKIFSHKIFFGGRTAEERLASLKEGFAGLRKRLDQWKLQTEWLEDRGYVLESAFQAYKKVSVDGLALMHLVTFRGEKVRHFFYKGDRPDAVHMLHWVSNLKYYLPWREELRASVLAFWKNALHENRLSWEQAVAMAGQKLLSEAADFEGDPDLMLEQHVAMTQDEVAGFCRMFGEEA